MNLPIASARDDGSREPRDRIDRTVAAGFFRSPLGVCDVEARSRRVSRWMSILYVVTALASPALAYFGPDVLSPAVPAIADAALDGRFALHAQAACTAAVTTNVTANGNARC
jgi:hypothetical protein